MEAITDIPTYLRAYAQELRDRILESHPPLHAIDDPPSPMISRLLRKPCPAQTLAIMGLVRRWQRARAGVVIAECGTGKTLISLAAVRCILIIFQALLATGPRAGERNPLSPATEHLPDLAEFESLTLPFERVLP